MEKNIERIFGLSSSEKTALLYILENGPATGYLLMTKANLTTHTGYSAPKKLTKKNLLQIKPNLEKPRPGQPMKKYYLTLLGLGVGLYVCSPKEGMEANFFDKVTKNWGFLLPLVVGKWTYFKSAGLGEEFIEAFEWVAKWIVEWGYYKEEWATENFWYYIFQMTAGSKKTKWLKALWNDPELKVWAIKGLKDQLHNYNFFMKMHKKTLEVLKIAEEPDWNKVASDLRGHAPPGYEGKDLKKDLSWLKKEASTLQGS